MIKYLSFKPLLKQTLWGGDKIAKLKQLADAPEGVGESWELSGVPGSETVVSGGPFDGQTLNEVVAALGPALMGQANYERFGREFPLLIKFIDAHQDLSIQVHPNDEVAHRHGKPRGKTEMWFVMESAPTAFLYSGLSMQLTPEDYKQRVADNTICDALARYNVGEGDVFFIPAGRIHAIGSGCFVAEIQQTSDVTYRIYDYDRRDKNGQPRELHTQQASESIDYRVAADYRTHYEPLPNQSVEVVSCPYFRTAVITVKGTAALDYTTIDSFVVLIAVKGSGTLTIDGDRIPLQAGHTLLLPATTTSIELSGTLTVLETHV